MPEDLIRYDILTQEAMRDVVRKVLSEIVRAGLPGEHHLYITFNTQAPGVRVSSRLRERYPEEMTIVIQHQFWDLEVNPQSFEIGLAFSGVPERLLVPFNAIKSFVDPSVQFGLQFDVDDEDIMLPTSGEETTDAGVFDQDQDLIDAAEAEKAGEAALELDKQINKEEDVSDDLEQTGADVVSLDAFRKKAE